MGVINIEDVRPGMVLDRDLRPPQGRVLLKGGQAVGEEHLRICRIWGVAEADVRGVSAAQAKQSALESLDPDVLNILRLLAEWRFKATDRRHPAVRGLVRVFLERNARGLSRACAREAAVRLRGPKPTPGEMPPPQPPLDCEEMLGREQELASLPAVFNEIVEAVKSPRSSASHVAEVIGRDQSLSARLLRIVNSPFYGFSGRVDTLQRAVAIVGTIQITNLALGIAVTTVFSGIPPEFLDMRAFWEHSVSVGVLARLLATHVGTGGEERMFVAGLLHDVGRLAVFRNFPEHARRMVLLGAAECEPMDALERREWGVSHARVGSLLMAQWQLPENLQRVVDCHHAPGRAEAPAEAALVHVADLVAHALALGHSGTRRVPPLDPAAWKRLGIQPSLLPSLAAQAESQMRDILKILLDDDA
ncbi:metal dependent phosphohydrolase [Desulfovibrio sp. X2]|uniref:HDOD domain-containing protein n=1 Tax=Desulfovibrio sp. X2 TaxID=941449 RepID=UPI000358B7B7|nr:HDOD domain-containing protein [Desulfovibrio sp. X2]EPR43378.1 metal dependent phosphohydrolase [Desulfovibrio sp. X2]